MVSNQHNLIQVGIDQFLCALKSLGVKKGDKSNETLKIKYSIVSPYSSYQRHLKPTKYEYKNKDDDEEDVRLPSLKHRVHKDKKNIIFKLAT